MTVTEARKLKKLKSIVYYGQHEYLYVRAFRAIGVWYIVIADKTTREEFTLLLSSVHVAAR